MIIISLDQATITGYAVSVDGKIIDSGTFDSKKKEYDHKISDIKTGMIALINKHSPHLVTVEDVQFQNNYEVYHKLSKLQGVLVNYLIENNILYEIIEPTRWKSKMLIKGRKREEQKANAILKALEYGYETVSEDVADAICMNIYANKCIIVKGV
jgi:Holliday junction resolvasome RuvABC endonuclease subunit